MRYIIHDDDGRITTNGYVDGYKGDIAKSIANAVAVDTFVDTNTHYVNESGLIVERPENPSKLSSTSIPADSLTITTLTVPKGSRVVLPILELTWDEVSSVQLIFDEPGKYMVKVKSFPQKDKELYIDAV